MVAMCATSGVKADFTFGDPVNLKSVLPILDPAYDAVDSFSCDGLEMYIDSKRPGGYGDWDIWVSRCATDTGEWSAPENLGPLVNTPSCDSEASISADGLEMYFTSDRPAGGPADIYLATRATKNDPWGASMNLGAEINSPLHDSEPWITPNGLELYFGSWRPGGYGQGDLWVTTRPPTIDAWAQPMNLGSAVNSPTYDGSPCVSSDGRMLFFHSRRQGGHGQTDLWMTRRGSASDAWEHPVNLGPQVNGPGDDAYPRLSPDGQSLYFWATDYQNYQVSIIPVVDFNADGSVDLADLVLLIDNWGTDNTLYDIGPYAWGDGKVDVEDLKVFIAHWEKEDASQSSNEQ
jgi:Tol biopolymer transport system component